MVTFMLNDLCCPAGKFSFLILHIHILIGNDELLHLGTFHLELVVHIGGSDGEHDHQRAEKNSGKGAFFSHGLFIYTQMNSPLGNPAALPRIAGHAVFAH